VGGFEDHVALALSALQKYGCVAFFAGIKKGLVKMGEDESAVVDFHWQGGYGAFSVSPTHVDALMQYIADQEKHYQR
jgi:hypothetical protein